MLLSSDLDLMQRKPSSRGQDASGAGQSNVSMLEELKSEPWQLLLSRIGDVLMLHLLMHAAIFKPLPNSCFLQLTGIPADQVSIPPTLKTSSQKHIAALKSRAWQ